MILVDLTADVTFSVLSGLREAVSASRIVLWVNAILDGTGIAIG